MTSSPPAPAPAGKHKPQQALPRPSSPHPHPHAQVVVIKLGTSSILNESTYTTRLATLSALVEACRALREAGHKVLLVCSGAIGVGKVQMNVAGKPPRSLGEKQALAAIGQCRLMALWSSLFGELNMQVAQVLITKNDLADRIRFRNARNTLLTLLHQLDVIPIVNENDTVSTAEIRFGDNDTLSAVTASLVDAGFLFLLTDVDGLYTGNPRSNPEARRLPVVRDLAAARRLVNVQSAGSSFGTGGMETKLIAAELASAAGVATVILNGQHPENIAEVVQAGLPERTPHAHQATGVATGTGSGSTELQGEPLVSSVSSLRVQTEEAQIEEDVQARSHLPSHTIFIPPAQPLSSRKWSILHALHPAGSVIIDEGAYQAMRKHDSGGRLLPAGVVAVEGNFQRMQAVKILVRQPRPGSDSAAWARNSPEDARQRKEQSRDHTQLDRQTQPSDLAHISHTPRGPLVPGSFEAQAWQDQEVGRGIANYTSMESVRIRGAKTSQIIQILGYADSDYITDQIVWHDH